MAQYRSITADFYAIITEDTLLSISSILSMDRSKIIAVVTGIISIALAIAYLLIVQIIDFRGEMLPAPIVETIGLGLLTI
jgi:hypothetical protein